MADENNGNGDGAVQAAETSAQVVAAQAAGSATVAAEAADAAIASANAAAAQAESNAAQALQMTREELTSWMSKAETQSAAAMDGLRSETNQGLQSLRAEMTEQFSSILKRLPPPPDPPQSPPPGEAHAAPPAKETAPPKAEEPPAKPRRAHRWM